MPIRVPILPSPFRRPGNGLALVEPQRPERQPRVPQVDSVHDGRSPGESPCGAVPGSQHLGGAGRGELEGFALGIPSVGGGGRISPKRDKVARLVPPELIPAFLEALVKSTRVLAGSRTRTKRTATSSLP